MKISSRVDGTVCGAVLSKRPSTALTRAVTGRRPFCAAAQDSQREPQRRPLNDSFFCSRTSLWLYSTFAPGADSKSLRRAPRQRDASHTYSTAAAAAPASRLAIQTLPQAPVRDPAVLLSFVPPEDDTGVDEHFEFYRDPFRRGYAPPDGPKLEISESKQDVEYPQKNDIYTANDQVKKLVSQLCGAIGVKLRHPHRVKLAAIHQLYTQLPEPRMSNLTGQWRHRLLKVMGTPRKRDMESMLRYFALVADVKNAGITLRRSQWNYALSFATKYAARAGTQEMESALRLWRDMERDAKIQGNDVTFNVLFDVAAKAGNYALAEMIYNEMDSRGIVFNRFHHVSLIYYFGLRLDSGGIRAAYREMVDSGEMIDTVALNCVIAGFLRCGEESAAEETYQKMRNGSSSAQDMPDRDYMMGKVVTKVLMMFSKIGKDHPQLKRTMQTNVQLTPDLRTYRLFVEHYAIKVGDLGKVAQYLDEMKFLKIPIHPTIFLALFKGFYVHGGHEGSAWSWQRLESVLSALYDARDEHARGFRIDRWVAIWALRAVSKCSTPEAVEKTYDDLSERWDIPLEKENFMLGLLENIVEGRDLRAKKSDNHGTLHRSYKTQPSARPSKGTYNSIT